MSDCLKGQLHTESAYGPQVQQLNHVQIVEGNFLGFSRLMAH